MAKLIDHGADESMESKTETDWKTKEIYEEVEMGKQTGVRRDIVATYGTHMGTKIIFRGEFLQVNSVADKVS